MGTYINNVNMVNLLIYERYMYKSQNRGNGDRWIDKNKYVFANDLDFKHENVYILKIIKKEKQEAIKILTFMMHVNRFTKVHS